MPIYQYRCEHCKSEKEVLQKMDDPAPECSRRDHGPMIKQFTVPAFKFKDGRGTDMGNSMSIPGYSLPQG